MEIIFAEGHKKGEINNLCDVFKCTMVTRTCTMAEFNSCLDNHTKNGRISCIACS